MLRKLLVVTVGVVFTWLAALPASADAGDAQTFQINGVDQQRGPYAGQLVLTEREEGQVDAVRAIRFQLDGTDQVDRGVLNQRGPQLRGVLRQSAGAAGRLNGERSQASLVSVQVDPRSGTCQGSCLGGQGVGSFRGQQAGIPEEPTNDVAERAAPERAPDSDSDASRSSFGRASDSASDSVANAPLGEPAVTPEPAVVDPPAPQPTQPPSGESFDGRPIYDFDPAFGITDPAGAYRIAVDWNSNTSFKERVDALLADPRISEIESIVFGNWDGDFPQEAIDAIFANKDKLAKITSFWCGDIDQEEAEISWIQQGDLGPLLQALPNLERLDIRGGAELSFGGPFRHEKLKTLFVESSNTSASAARSLGRLELPALERLELWLGTDEYGADTTVDDLKGIFSGKGLPSLKDLGLMNSVIVDEMAAAVVDAPLLARLERLDFSMGTLTDKGAQHLLASEAKFAHLKSLNLRHHYMTDPVVAKLEAWSINVGTGDQQDYDPQDDWRYTEVGE